MRKKTTEKVSISLPIGVASELRKWAKEEHAALSTVVARACRQYVEKLRDYAHDGALFSRASFYAMCDVAAAARGARPVEVQRIFLAKASRLMVHRRDAELELELEEGEN